MTDLSFWDIYFPVLIALLSSVALLETVHIGLGYLYNRYQIKKYMEFQEKIKSGEIELPPELLDQMESPSLGRYRGMFPGMVPPNQAVPTVSGEGPGQYL